tara:strand:- start:2974 stop:3381 length:408 start_codon:yes stop_codon:yes gene_type:complete
MGYSEELTRKKCEHLKGRTPSASELLNLTANDIKKFETAVRKYKLCISENEKQLKRPAKGLNINNLFNNSGSGGGKNPPLPSSGSQNGGVESSPPNTDSKNQNQEGNFFTKNKIILIVSGAALVIGVGIYLYKRK